MDNWRKVGYFADSIVYASGNTHKLVKPHRPDIYFELDTKRVWWNQGSRNDKPVESIKDKQ